MEGNLTLYDFCGTLVDFQTANQFVLFVIERKGLQFKIVETLRKFLNKTGTMAFANYFHPQMSVNKALLLYQLKGITYSELNRLAKEFYTSRIKPHLIIPVLKRLQEDIKIGNTVSIVSGGYDIYIQHFAQEYNIRDVICSSLHFTAGIFTGKIRGNDCMNNEKVRLLQDHFKSTDLSSVFDNIAGYSDSISDLPLLRICNNRIIVQPYNTQNEWANRIGAELLTY